MQLLHFSKEFCYDPLITFMLAAESKNCVVFTHEKYKIHITPIGLELLVMFRSKHSLFYYYNTR